MGYKLHIQTPEFAIAGAGFVTATEAAAGKARTLAKPLEVMITDEKGNTGHGECMPHPHFHHDIGSTSAEIESVRHEIMSGTVTRENLNNYLPKASPARNAIDAALWDLECKQKKQSIWQLTSTSKPEKLRTVYTLSVAKPEDMVKQLQSFGSPVSTIKMKLAGNEEDIARIQAVHAAAPDSRIIVDANAGFKSIVDYRRFEDAALTNGVSMVEQPFAPEHDEWLTQFEHRIPVFADESMQTREDLPRLKGKFEGVNIKLDKTGGLTEALKTLDDAKAHGMKIMVGTMLASSLSMAPAYVLASRGEEVYAVDIDSPLLLAQDRRFGLKPEGDCFAPPSPQLWGGETQVRYPAYQTEVLPRW